ncbi:MAG: hypothetical protein LBF86_03675 [Helicobacteraceae bacterium]|nr:hypothetical protein [Helicobacteraceae bacterium]
MEEAGLSLLLIALGAALIITVIVILWQLRSRFGGGVEPIESDERPQSKAKETKQETINRRKSGALIVAGKRFAFSYDESKEEDVKRLINLIKSSLALLKESKYPDIVFSRARECEGLIVKLKGITGLDEIAIGEIVDCFKEYVDKLSRSLG